MVSMSWLPVVTAAAAAAAARCRAPAASGSASGALPGGVMLAGSRQVRSLPMYAASASRRRRSPVPGLSSAARVSASIAPARVPAVRHVPGALFESRCDALVGLFSSRG